MHCIGVGIFGLHLRQFLLYTEKSNVTLPQSDSDYLTGLPDLQNLVLRLEKGDSDSSSVDVSAEDENVRVAEHAYDYLLVVIDDEGHSVGNGIIILRATDKIFDAWNELLEADNFDKEVYKQAALRAVAAKDKFNAKSVYHLVAQAFVDMFGIAECSIAGLAEIKSGVEAMRTRIEDALEYEKANNGRLNIIKGMTDKLIAIERGYPMRETSSGVELSVATAAIQTTGAAPGRGNRTSHNAADWTDEHRLQVLTIYRDMPNSTHKARADEFNRRFPGVDRTRNGMRQEHARLVSYSYS